MRAFTPTAVLVVLISLAGSALAETHFKRQVAIPFDKEMAMAIMFGDTQFAGKACPGLSVDGDAVLKTLYEHGTEMMDLESEGVEEMWLHQQGLRAKERLGVACPAILDAYGPHGTKISGLVVRTK